MFHVPEDNLQVRNDFYFERFMRKKKQVHHRKNSTTTIALINQNGIFINNQTNNYLI